MKKNESESNHTKYEIRPASSEEAGLFYAMPPEKDAELGCIGHVRIDFGRGGDRFYHTWHPRGPEDLNTQGFKDELTEVVDAMRENVLKNFAAMTGYCRGHGGEISGGWVQNYGYIVETENYRYCLRCNPAPGDYQAYLTCFDKRVQEMRQEQKPRQFGLTEEGQRMLRAAADPDAAHTYRWYVIENILDGEHRADHELPLEDAVRLYAGLDCGDKRLGVTKDGIATVDLVICQDGREWFPEDHQKLASFAGDQVVKDAIQQLHDALDTPEQGMTMGGM